MARAMLALIFLAIIQHSTVLAVNDLDLPESMEQMDHYGSQRQCALDCFNWSWIQEKVGNAIGCHVLDTMSRAQNSCFCRADLQDGAVAYISSCVQSACATNSVDIASATNYYKTYCEAKITPVHNEVTTGTATQGTATQSTWRRFHIICTPFYLEQEDAEVYS
jgi:hypothetical protein